jgi:enamine deaminase RidA (YjgF/YER057c/UK114 family)
MRKLVSSGTTWEEKAGYSRAVRTGPLIEVAGTTAVRETGEVVGKGDVAAQTEFVIRKIQKALQAAGADLTDVVRTRMYITRIEDWEIVAQIHGSFFGTIRPASTLLEVSGLIDSELLIEMEATAWKEEAGGHE